MSCRRPTFLSCPDVNPRVLLSFHAFRRFLRASLFSRSRARGPVEHHTSTIGVLLVTLTAQLTSIGVARCIVRRAMRGYRALSSHLWIVIGTVEQCLLYNFRVLPERIVTYGSQTTSHPQSRCNQLISVFVVLQRGWRCENEGVDN
eukprot:m.336993 g.336993  ORF g.336993 m.336993 type:complete len:146 (-) comp16532_c1_seq4:17936-18373(-)